MINIEKIIIGILIIIIIMLIWIICKFIMIILNAFWRND